MATANSAKIIAKKGVKYSLTLQCQNQIIAFNAYILKWGNSVDSILCVLESMSVIISSILKVLNMSSSHLLSSLPNSNVIYLISLWILTVSTSPKLGTFLPHFSLNF